MSNKIFALTTMCAAALLAVTGVAVLAQDDENEARLREFAEAEAKKRAAEAEAKSPAPAPAEKPTLTPALKVYEWGVETLNWDGTAEKEVPGEIPSFYYKADQIPLVPRARGPVARPPVPDPGDPSGGMDKKPVLYFESDKQLRFNLEVSFSSGEPTWLYPKATSRPDVRTLRWEDVDLTFAGPTAAVRAPKLAEVPKDHWANYSREGSENNWVTINGESERFIFYEGVNRALPEVDIFKNDNGEYVVRNYTAYPIYNVRWTYKTDKGVSRLCAREVPAARGETPGELRLVMVPDGVVWEIAAELRQDLALETSSAGLTAAQAGVFARCWHDDITGAKPGTLSYRRDARQLDDLMKLKVELKVECGFSALGGVKFSRVGYMVINGVDLERQSGLDELAVLAASGDKEASQKLVKQGMAGVGAVRRALADKGTAVRQRVTLARLLQDMAKAIR